MKSGLNHTRTTPDVKHTDAKLDAKGTESVEKAVNETIKRLEESMEAQGEELEGSRSNWSPSCVRCTHIHPQE